MTNLGPIQIDPAKLARLEDEAMSRPQNAHMVFWKCLAIEAGFASENYGYTIADRIRKGARFQRRPLRRIAKGLSRITGRKVTLGEFIASDDPASYEGDSDNGMSREGENGSTTRLIERGSAA